MFLGEPNLNQWIYFKALHFYMLNLSWLEATKKTVSFKGMVFLSLEWVCTQSKGREHTFWIYDISTAHWGAQRDQVKHISVALFILNGMHFKVSNDLAVHTPFAKLKCFVLLQRLICLFCFWIRKRGNSSLWFTSAAVQIWYLKYMHNISRINTVLCLSFIILWISDSDMKHG